MHHFTMVRNAYHAIYLNTGIMQIMFVNTVQPIQIMMLYKNNVWHVNQAILSILLNINVY